MNHNDHQAADASKPAAVHLEHLKQPGTKPPAAAEPRCWVIAMPAGMELLNANDRGHWARRSRLTAGLRECAGWLAKAQKIPALERVRIAVEYQPPKTGRLRDGGNWAPSGKACIDGLRDAQVIRDDNSQVVLSETYSIGEPYPRGRIVITLTEVAAGDSR